MIDCDYLPIPLCIQSIRASQGAENIIKFAQVFNRTHEGKKKG